MEKYHTGRMYNSTAKDCVSKSWAHSNRQSSESGCQATTRVQGRNVITPWCFQRKSYLNTITDPAMKTRARNTSTSKPNPKREVQNARYLEAPRTFPNPYAPHLKYGIFPKNRVKPKSPTKRVSRVIRREYTDLKREASSTDSPFFSVRPVAQEDLELVTRTRPIGYSNAKCI